jgi:hypothetical protein
MLNLVLIALMTAIVALGGYLKVAHPPQRPVDAPTPPSASPPG